MDYHRQKNKPAGARTFGERSISWFPTKPTEVPHTDEFLDDSAMGGVHCNKTLAPSPKSPGDFRFAVQLMSMPFQRLPVDPMHPLEDKGVHCTLCPTFCQLHFYYYHSRLLENSNWDIGKS